MKLGFIGTGSMGSILIEAFLDAKVIEPTQIAAHNRTREKVERLAAKYTGLQIAASNKEAARHADILFLCVKPLEFKNVIDEISPSIEKNQIVISITSPVTLEDLERTLPGKVAKVIPSITNSVHSGASLAIFGKRLNEEDRKLILSLFSQISDPVEVDDRFVRASSDIASCGPAFISFLLQKIIDAAVEETGIPRSEATALVTRMVIGLGDLFAKDKYTLETLQKRVCVPGGVTGEGISVLEAELGPLFHHLFQKTHEKHREDLKHLEKMFN